MNKRARGPGGRKAGGRAEKSAEGAAITDVQPDAGKPGCVGVRSRGHRRWRIDDDAAADLGIARGRIIDAALLARLDQAAANTKARLKLQTRLATRQLSRLEAGALMRKAGAEPDYGKRVIARFEQLGWIDDAKLAEAVASHEAARPVGKMRVVARVARRGIGGSEARRAAESAVAARRESPLELAVIAAKSQVRKLPPRLDNDTKRRRVLGFLARRGFDEHTAREALEDVIGRRDGDGDGDGAD